MFADDAGGDGLSPIMKVRAQAELAAGEQLLWAGRARRLAPPASWETTILAFIGALLVGGLLLSFGPAGFFLLLCLVVGGGLLAVTLRRHPQVEGSFYALTDRRAILWLPARPAGSYQVRSFRP